MENAHLLQTEILRRWALSARSHLAPSLFGPAPSRPLPRGWRGWLMIAETIVGAALLIPPALQLVFGSESDGRGGYLALALLGLVLLSLRFPLWAWRGSLLLALATGFFAEGSKTALFEFVFLIAIYGLASHTTPRTTARWMAALTVLCGAIGFLLGYGQRMWAATAVAIVAVVMIDAMRDWQQTREALEVETANVEREHSHRAVLEERARIGRELHDIVAHHMSMIAVQTETAPYRLGDLPEPVRAEFVAINGAARAGLSEMRRLLSILRNDEQAPREPQPDLSGVAELIETARAAGLQIEFSGVPGDEVSPSVGLCAYRIVQEALTNAGRHAAGSAVAVRVASSDGAIRIEVTNGPARGGTPTAGEEATGAGHGLTSMRERAHLLSGSLTALPLAGGGFSVTAVLPLEAAR